MTIESTMLHDALKTEGRQTFIATMTKSGGKDCGPKIASDLQVMVESAVNAKGTTGQGMHLSRLAGYLGSVATLLGSLPAIGMHFAQTADGAMVASLGKPATTEGAKEAGDDLAHLDALDGPELDAALAKMTTAQRDKYLQAG
jgi:hypothetical protein